MFTDNRFRLQLNCRRRLFLLAFIVTLAASGAIFASASGSILHHVIANIFKDGTHDIGKEGAKEALHRAADRAFPGGDNAAAKGVVDAFFERHPVKAALDASKESSTASPEQDKPPYDVVVVHSGPAVVPASPANANAEPRLIEKEIAPLYPAHDNSSHPEGHDGGHSGGWAGPDHPSHEASTTG
ncbi:MAG: hypothetical protein ABUL58_04085 [Steroidobacter sp.]